MDIRSIDEADPTLTFDLLRSWARGSLYRHVGHTSPPGCPWQSLSAALRRARRERLRDEAAFQNHRAEMRRFSHQSLNEEPTQSCLQRCLIKTYSTSSGVQLEAIIQAKLDDETSFFSIFLRRSRIQTVQKAYHYWAWYLYCLAVGSSEFAPGSNEEGVVVMPLDRVDLQVISTVFSTHIAVTKLMEESERYAPSEKTVGEPPSRLFAEVLHHNGYWAPLLGSVPPDEDESPLVDAIVKIGGLRPGPLEKFDGRPAYIVGFDKNNDYYQAAVASWVLPVERKNITQILYHDNLPVRPFSPHAGKDLSASARKNAPLSSQVFALREIPDGSLDFQLLQEKVRRFARKRLLEMLQGLAGTAGNAETTGLVNEVFRQYGPLPENNCHLEDLRTLVRSVAAARDVTAFDVWEETASWPPTSRSSGLPRMLPFKQGFENISKGNALELLAPCKWEPADGRGMRLQPAQEVLVKSCTEDGCWCIGWLAEDKFSAEAWVPIEKLIVWITCKAFEPSADWNQTYHFLRLEMGDVVVVETLYHEVWQNWAQVRRWNVDGKPEAGLINMGHVNPFFLLNQAL